MTISKELHNLKKELAAHSIKVAEDGATIFGINGPKQLPIRDAVKYLKTHAVENAMYLMKLWNEASTVCTPKGHYPSDEITQKLFVAAVKHLLKQAANCRPLKENGCYHKLFKLAQSDISEVSHHMMSKFVEYRLAIDWVTHLVEYDDYRAELLETYASVNESPAVKTALYFGRDFDNPGEKSIPWNLYRDRLTKHRAEPTPPNEEKNEIERSNEWRTEKGMSEVSEHGFLDDYDEISKGLNFKKRSRNTMQNIWEENQKWRDYSTVEFGARSIDDKDNLAPHEKSTSIYRR